jgi:hypothetical protein
MKSIKSILLVALVASLAIVSSGCKDATRAQWNALGSRHKVTLYSGGQKVGEWTSTGNVSNQSQSDGWYFEDEKTHKLIEVAGTLVIEQL